MSNPVTRKQHIMKQNILLVREENVNVGIAK